MIKLKKKRGYKIVDFTLIKYRCIKECPGFDVGKVYSTYEFSRSDGESDWSLFEPKDHPKFFKEILIKGQEYLKITKRGPLDKYFDSFLMNTAMKPSPYIDLFGRDISKTKRKNIEWKTHSDF